MRKHPPEPSQLAMPFVEEASEENLEPKNEKPKNPAAVALGRLGGLKGGKARAAKLSTERKRAIASRAASIRWKRKD